MKKQPFPPHAQLMVVQQTWEDTGSLPGRMGRGTGGFRWTLQHVWLLLLKNSFKGMLQAQSLRVELVLLARHLWSRSAPSSQPLEASASH